MLEHASILYGICLHAVWLLCLLWQWMAAVSAVALVTCQAPLRIKACHLSATETSSQILISQGQSCRLGFCQCCRCSYTEEDLKDFHILLGNNAEEEISIMPSASHEMFNCFCKVSQAASPCACCTMILLCNLLLLLLLPPLLMAPVIANRLHSSGAIVQLVLLYISTLTELHSSGACPRAAHTAAEGHTAHTAVHVDVLLAMYHLCLCPRYVCLLTFDLLYE